ILTGYGEREALRLFCPLLPSDTTRIKARTVAVIAALRMLASIGLPRAKTLFFMTDEEAGSSPHDFFIPLFAGELEETTAEEGLLLVSSPRLAPSQFSLLVEARDALQQAGFTPGLSFVKDKADHADLGFLLPGRPEEGKSALGKAIMACTGLLYGLTGYHALAFDFDD
ncbi:MAG: hypothetical protein GX493_01660, partial [Firmicutes bacterium]|nr:hypothetical protein [Bacillota bacterium]